MAAPDGKIEIELSLLIENAIKRAQEAATKMGIALKGVGTGKEMAAATDKATASQDKLTRAVKETNKQLSEAQQRAQRLRDIASGKILGSVIPGQQINIGNVSRGTPLPTGPGAVVGGNTASGLATLPLGVRQALNNMGMNRLGTINQPQVPSLGKLAPPPIPPQSFLKQFGPMIASAIGTGVGGPLGGAVAGLLTKANPAVAATTAAMTLLRKAVEETAAAFERARDTYAASVQSGFGLRAQNQRSELASIIGVSQADIYQYGNAIAQLNAKIQFSVKIFTETNGALTATAWNFKILKENISAAWAKIAEAVAPAVNRLIELANAVLKLNVLSGAASVLGTVFGLLVDQLTRLVAISQIAVGAVELMVTTIKDLFKNAVAWLNNQIANTFIGKKLGFKEQSMPGFEDTKEAYGAFKDILKAAIAVPEAYKYNAGAPTAFMKQLPASNWERMGLNIGGGGGTNYNQQTANNTKNISVQIKQLIQVMTNNHQYTAPKGMPAGA